MALLQLEEQSLLGGGVLIGAVKHLSDDDWNQVRVEVMSEEAVTTSAIEGEILNRISVQSSIQRQLGLREDAQRGTSKRQEQEQGISELMVSFYSTINQPLSKETLFGWHRMVRAGSRNVDAAGSFRTGAEPMQVVSGAMYAPKVHFEALPSAQVAWEMSRFLDWFERTAPGGRELLPAVTRRYRSPLL